MDVRHDLRLSTVDGELSYTSSNAVFPPYTTTQEAKLPLSFVAVLVSLVLAYLGTLPYRQLFHVPRKIQVNADNAVPMIPYWIPYIGHIIPFSYDVDSLLTKIGLKMPFDIFALKLAGSRHYMINNPSLVTKVLVKKEKEVSYAQVVGDMCRTLFGLSPDQSKEFVKHLKQYQTTVINGLMRDPGLRDTVQCAVHNMEEVVPNLISLSEPLTESHPWEAYANIRTLSPETAEVDLYPLIRDALAHATNPAIMGKQFLKDFSTATQDLWLFDDAFLPLVSGVPEWVPVPQIRKSVRARNRLIPMMQAWVDDYRMSLREDIKGKDFSDVSELMRMMIKMLDQTSMNSRGGGSVVLIVFWALNANANNLTFWLIIRLASDPNLLSRIRSEIEPYTAGTPDLKISVEGLMNDCPLLKATYLETNRLHSRPISFRTIGSDTVVVDDDYKSFYNSSNGEPSAPPTTSHLLRKNSYLYVPHFLHHISPKYFPEPDVFRPERFLVNVPSPTADTTTTDTNIPKQPTVDMKTLRPYGGGSSACKGRLFAEREVLTFVAGFISIWDVEDVRGGPPSVPGNVKASATAKPNGVCRVRLSRR